MNISPQKSYLLRGYLQRMALVRGGALEAELVPLTRLFQPQLLFLFLCLPVRLCSLPASDFMSCAATGPKQQSLWNHELKETSLPLSSFSLALCDSDNKLPTPQFQKGKKGVWWQPPSTVSTMPPALWDSLSAECERVCSFRMQLAWQLTNTAYRWKSGPERRLLVKALTWLGRSHNGSWEVNELWIKF